jgi:hypothetical protein
MALIIIIGENIINRKIERKMSIALLMGSNNFTRRE